MATILDLFNSQKKELYDNDLIRIESRGFINPPRVAALAASSPKVAADLIGGQLSGILGGSANRPSDTIFKKGNALSKPITITAVTQALLRDAVDGGYGANGENNGGYVIKANPSPDSVINDIMQGGSSAQGVATNLAISALNKYGSKNGFKELKNVLKTKREGDDKNGSFGDPKYTNVKPFSKFKSTSSGLVEHNKKLRGWDNANNFAIIDKQSYDDYNSFEEALAKYPNANLVPVVFKKYGNSTIIPFVGSINGISEDVTPEWNGFRYIGSPFKIYRYSGVERSLKFNLKLYYIYPSQREIMIKKINYLKSLAFPYETISTIEYNDGNKTNAQIAFSPNLLYVSIGDMYKNVFGYMESLSFSIDENVTWNNFEVATADKKSERSSLYPSVIDVSIGIKLIENSHETKSGTGTVTYNYNFDGRTSEIDIVEKKEETEKTKSEAKPKPKPESKPTIDFTLSDEQKASLPPEAVSVYDNYMNMKQ